MKKFLRLIFNAKSGTDICLQFQQQALSWRDERVFTVTPKRACLALSKVEHQSSSDLRSEHSGISWGLLVTPFPPCAPTRHPTRPPPSQWQPFPPNAMVQQHIPSPISHATPVPSPCDLADPLGDLLAQIGLNRHLQSTLQLSTPNCPIGIIS